MKTIAVIPAYNEETTLADTLDRTRPFVDEIIVVNDGSRDRTRQIAAGKKVLCLSHAVNRGLGASLGSGLIAALERGADAIITLDADGQHDPAEIPDFIAALNHGADVVIGSRMLTRTGMPFIRQIAQVIGNVVTFILFGAWVTDSQSGFRAFNASAARRIRLRTNRMEVSSEIIAEAKAQQLTLVEIPIKAIYTEYSLSKGQNFFEGLRTLIKLILRRLTD
ncbi:glycosyltransferase family 2 protein [Patescibacteria group bacterium]|nr:glycosyltransferase family 2 protein [Patescibacteria group bacterium]MBU1705455.1 glycosyltransferase family 2 protein [Patescibacteria group bacterium]